MKTNLLKSAGCLLLLGLSVQAQTEEPKCTNETLKGSYGLLLTGSRPTPVVPPGQAGYVGQMEQVAGIVVQTFDGKGNFTQVDNVKGTISGLAPDRPGRGTYTVNPDCSVTQVVMPMPGLQVVSKGVIVDGGKEFRQVTVSPDLINVVTLGRKIN